MLVTAAQVADTVRLLIPGFILARVFYTFGLKTRRSDAVWVLWSIIATVPISALAVALTGDRFRSWELPVALALAIAGGALLAVGWRLLVRYAPNATAEADIRAWDVILRQSRWLQVECVDGRSFLGRSLYAARSVDTDDLDLYLVEPQAVRGGELLDLPGVEGILMPRSRIAHVVVLAGDAGEPAEPAASPYVRTSASALQNSSLPQ